MYDHLDELEAQVIYIFREAYRKFENLAMLYSIGKDSTTMIHLARKAFFGKIPFPLVHIDTTYKYPEMIEYRDRMAREWERGSDCGPERGGDSLPAWDRNRGVSSAARS